MRPTRGARGGFGGQQDDRPPGFEADYAIAWNSSFAGLWQLSDSGAHVFVAALTQQYDDIGASCDLEVSGFDLAQNEAARLAVVLALTASAHPYCVGSSSIAAGSDVCRQNIMISSADRAL